MEKNTKPVLVIGVIIILLVSTMAYFAFQKSPEQIVNVSKGINPAKGNINANITIVEFSDFECPACRFGVSVIKELLDEYPTEIAIYYRNFPLTSIHPNAFLAAEAAQAANAQGKFWEYHDKLFENQKKLDKENLIKYAQEIGLDADKFRQDLESRKYTNQVQSDIGDANKAGVRATPTFFVNGKQVIGADKQKIKQLIEEELR